MKRWTSLALGALLGTSSIVSGCMTQETSCVARGTLVETSDGPKPIELLAVGDKIFAVNPDTGERVVTRISVIRRARRECVKLCIGANHTLRCTSDHPLYDPMARAWAPAGDWVLGRRDTLALSLPELLANTHVTEVSAFDGVDDVFDLTVESGFHNFIAAGVLVHNKSILQDCQYEGQRAFYGDPCTCPDGSTGSVECDHQTDLGTCACDEGDATSDTSHDIADATSNDAPDEGTSTDSADDTSEDVEPDTSIPPASVRFVIEVTNDVPESIYVQLNEEDGQTSWVTVTNAQGERVWFDERCEIPDCDGPSGVCGAALPQVLDITAGTFTGGIERYWSRLDSTLSTDSSGQSCERRVSAPPGTYTATFCWSLSAQLDDPTADATQGAAGHITDPVCIPRTFTLPDDVEVIYQISGG